MKNDHEIDFQTNFSFALKNYYKLIRYKCRQYSTHRLPEDDLFSESCIVLMRIVRHHHHLGIESNEFKNLLMKSIKNRVLDLKRKFFAKSRNGLEIEFDSSLDNFPLEESWSSASHCPDPSEVVETIQLIERLHSILSEVDRKMLDAILNPSDDLIRRAREKDIQVLQRSRRRSHGAHTEIPVHLLGAEAGLTYRQALRSLDRIRHSIKQLCDD